MNLPDSPVNKKPAVSEQKPSKISKVSVSISTEQMLEDIKKK